MNQVRLYVAPVVGIIASLILIALGLSEADGSSAKTLAVGFGIAGLLLFGIGLIYVLRRRRRR